MSKMFSAALAIAITLGTMNATTARAEIESVGVRFADIDLSTEAGKRTLDRRIDRAARQVCGVDETATGSHIRSRDAQACYEQAMRSTRASVARAIETSRTIG